MPDEPFSYPVPGKPEEQDILLAFRFLNAMGKLPNKTLTALASQAHDFLKHRPPDPVSLYQELLLLGVRVINALFSLGGYLGYASSINGALARDIYTTIATVIADGEDIDEEDLEELVEVLFNAGWFLLKALDLAEKLADDWGEIPELARAETCNLAELLRTKFGDMGKVELSPPQEYLAILLLAAALRLEATIMKTVHARIANKSVIRGLNRRYAELTGDQYYPEKTAHDYLDSSLGYIMHAPLRGDRPFKRAERVLRKLDPLIQEFQTQAIKEVKQSRHLEEIGNPISLDTENEGEDGEVCTLSDMMIAPPDLEEAWPQLLEIWENLHPKDAKLLRERFIDGKSLNEIAVEQRWSYDRTQKRIERLVKKVLREMSE